MSPLSEPGWHTLIRHKHWRATGEMNISKLSFSPATRAVSIAVHTFLNTKGSNYKMQIFWKQKFSFADYGKIIYYETEG